MLNRLRFLSHVLGRRETLKYLSIAAVGAAIAPLTGCSGSTLAFSEFAAGDWNVTFPKEDGDRTFALTVNDNGTWSADVTYPDITLSTTGTWSLTGGNLTVTEQNTDETLLLRDDEDGGMALSIPAEVDEDEMISSFQWAYANGGLEVPVSWDKDSQTLTLIGVSATAGAPMPIVAVKESK